MGFIGSTRWTAGPGQTGRAISAFSPRHTQTRWHRHMQRATDGTIPSLRDHLPALGLQDQDTAPLRQTATPAPTHPKVPYASLIDKYRVSFLRSTAHTIHKSDTPDFRGARRDRQQIGVAQLLVKQKATSRTLGSPPSLTTRRRRAAGSRGTCGRFLGPPRQILLASRACRTGTNRRTMEKRIDTTTCWRPRRRLQNP